MMLHLTVGMIIDSARFCADWRSCNTLVMIKHSAWYFPRSWRGDRYLPGRIGYIALRVELFDEEVERLSLFDR